MKGRVKITITWGDGSPICGLTPDPDTVFLTDNAPFLLARKNGDTVEAVCGGLESVRDFLEGLTETD